MGALIAVIAVSQYPTSSSSSSSSSSIFGGTCAQILTGRGITRYNDKAPWPSQIEL